MTFEIALFTEPLQVASDISFTGAEIALIAGLLSAVISALGFVFKMYLGVISEQKVDLRRQVDEKQREVEYWQSLAEHGTLLSEVSTGELRRTRDGHPEPRR